MFEAIEMLGILTDVELINVMKTVLPEPVALAEHVNSVTISTSLVLMSIAIIGCKKVSSLNSNWIEI